MRDAKIPILMYHSIELMPKNTVMRSLHVPPKRFNFQMWILKKLGYQALSIRGLQPYIDGSKKGKVVGITFDDGYKNNLLNAGPILKKFNFSATCYIVSKKIGKTNEWDLDANITQSKLMSNEEIQQWIDLGMDIGAHTQTHANLNKVDYAIAKKEVMESKTDLENLFNLTIGDFCYPFGQFNKSIVELVKSAGFKSATTMNRGKAHNESDKYMLPRIPITHHTLPHLFLIKLLTNYEEKR
jgi:peptidoglycan/xylan/chitin deacetylase (PgdA/CDA1 family)